MKGCLVMDNMKDVQESIVLTFWETKEDMDAFYDPDNKTLSNFVETAKTLFEQMPKRNDYQRSSIEIYI
jgi:heme-degrading monooxygenase HmoA